jgi:hypothetical protein
MVEQTNIYQSCFICDDCEVFDYFKVIEDLPRGFVKIIGLGRLEIKKTGERSWSPSRDRPDEYLPYPLCVKPRYWKNSVASEGDGRIPGGRILRSRHGGGSREKNDWLSLAECYPPPEYVS